MAATTHAIKLKARIGAGAVLEWLELLPDLPPSEVEIIVLYEHKQDFTEPDTLADNTASLEPATNILDADDDPEWAALTPEEQAGHARRNLTPDEIVPRLRWIDEQAGCIRLPVDQAREIAMDEWIAEENL
jgi:hypothetical protein